MRRTLAVLGLALPLLAPTSRAQNDPSYSYPSYEDNSVERDLGKPVAPMAPEPVKPSEPTPSSEAAQSSEEPAVTMPDETAPQATQAPEPAPKPTAAPKQKQYKVWIWQENGDTLWRIAQKVYGDKDKWRLIYLANRDVIKDPNKIYPKQKLKIPPPDWQP